jgi:hypothetical protein
MVERDAGADDRLGLCARCVHHRPVPTRRGMTYHRCALAETRPELERYPKLPVRSCRGYQPDGS